MTFEDKVDILLKNSIIKNRNELHELDGSEKYYDDLNELETFFQGYLDNAYPFNNPIFVFGSTPTLNAWACYFNDVDSVCVNLFVCTTMRDFMNKNNRIISKGLQLHIIDTVYDNSLSATKIMLQVSEMYLFYHEVGHLLQEKSPVLLNIFTDEQINTGVFDIVDHVSEIDADFYASVRLPMHLFAICDRELRYTSIEEQTKYLEDC